MLIPILGIVFGVGAPMLAVILATYYAHRSKVAKYDTVKKALEGNLSPEQVDQLVKSLGSTPPAPVNPRKKSLTNGIILLSIAIAIFLGSMVMGYTKGFILGALVLGFLGMANLMIAFFVQKDDGGDSR
ncbi:MAG: DUF6249 domain-containing protein [Candidatus Fermentibacteraceae bacterium]